MPELIDLYEAHRDHRDKFEILAFHDASAKSFEELDKKLEPIIKNTWGGKTLPFPILLDSTGATIREFGITAFPTTVLIDPEGKLVGYASKEALEAKLPPLPMGVRLARALDGQVYSSVDDTQLGVAVEQLAHAADVPIRLSDDGLRAAGISGGVTVPLTLSGRLSLRSWLNVLLDAHALTFTTEKDGLLVAPRAPGEGPPKQDSELQRMCLKRIEARLRENTAFEFEAQPISAVAAYLEKKTDENFILDPAARQAGKLDPNTKVSGADRGKPLGEALTAMLRPLNLTYVIRDELVVLTPLRVQP